MRSKVSVFVGFAPVAATRVRRWGGTNFAVATPMHWETQRGLATSSHVPPTSTVADGVARKLGPLEFTRIYTEHRTFVTKMLFSRGVRPLEVEDAVQEVFLTLFRRSPALDSDLAVRAWLREVAAKVALNRARTRRRRDRHSIESVAVELDLLADEHAPSPERRTLTQEQYTQVCGLIDRLSSKRRDVLVLCYFEQLSAKDIAHRLGTRQSIVNSRLRLARAELKDAIRASSD